VLVFDAKTHTYRHPETGEAYISTTTLIGKYKKPFDVEKHAARVAERKGVTPEEIKAEWKEINEASKVYGTEKHTVLEQYLKEKTYDTKHEAFIKAYDELGIIQDSDQILAEERLYNHAYKLAGTADIIRKDTQGGFSVFDLKTNRNFSLSNQYGEYLLAPVSHMNASEYSVYALQLSIYAFMYHELTGLKLNQMGIFYYDRTINKFKYYPVPYLKAEVLDILNHYASR
jgi:hypothetical protein